LHADPAGTVFPGIRSPAGREPGLMLDPKRVMTARAVIATIRREST
jgi:hypothetical protein